MLAQLRSQYITGSAQFRPQYEADGAELLLDIDVYAGNVSDSLSSITSPLSSSPVVWIDARPATRGGSNGSGWLHLNWAMTNAAGKTPVFQLNRATMSGNTSAPDSRWRPAWTQDFVTWVQSESVTLVGGSSGYIQFEFADPLPSGTVYFSTHSWGLATHAADLAAELLTSYSSVASPTASADSGGVFSTTPAETDDIGRDIGGNPMYAIKLSWGGGTTDGARKRKLVMLAGMHSAGEHMSWTSFEAAVRWMLDDASAAAVALRANWDVWLYFNVTPNGIKGGHRRHNFRSSIDPNRNFVNRTLAEIAALTTAVEADTSTEADALFSWHGYGGQKNAFIPGTRTSPNSETSAFIALGESVFGAPAVDYFVDIAGSDITWGYDILGAKVSFASEVPGRGDTSAAYYQSIGENWIKTLQLADASGVFFTSTTLTAQLTAQESGQDSASLSATSPVVGALSISESGSDTAAASASVSVSCALTALEDGADTYSGQVSVVEGRSAQLTAQETGVDTTGCAALVSVVGYLGAQEAGADIAALSAVATVSTSVAAAESGQDIYSGNAVMGDTISARLAAQETGSDSASGAALVVIQGGLSAGESGSDSCASAALVLIQGGLSAQEVGSDTYSGNTSEAEPYRVTAITGSVPESRIIGAIPSNRIVGAA